MGPKETYLPDIKKVLVTGGGGFVGRTIIGIGASIKNTHISSCAFSAAATPTSIIR